MTRVSGSEYCSLEIWVGISSHKICFKQSIYGLPGGSEVQKWGMGIRNSMRLVVFMPQHKVPASQIARLSLPC